jgi:hypothetical protein
MRILFAIGWFLAGSAAILAMVIVGHQAGYMVVFPEGKYQVELATLFLAAATLIITTVAMLLAVAAVVGYTALKDSATAAGRAAGLSAAQDLLAGMVQQEVEARLAAQGLDRTEELTAALAERGNDGGPAQD